MPREACETIPAKIHENDGTGHRYAAVLPDQGSHLGRGLVIRRLLGQSRRNNARVDQGPGDRAVVMAVTAHALAGRGGMAGLLWSNAWLSEVVVSREDCPDKASCPDTIPPTEIRPVYLSRKATAKLRFRQKFGSDAWAA